VTPDLDFEGMQLLDVEYLRNGRRQRLHYNGVQSELTQALISGLTSNDLE